MDSTDSEGNEVLPEKIKVPKHVIEKKRRARINSCLGELKKLVIEKHCLKGQRSSKLEKADILELTVDFLKRKAKLPYPSLESSDVRDLQTKLYARGYRECVDQVSKYLKSTGITQSVSDTLLSELETVAQKLISKNTKLSDKHLTSMYVDGNSLNGLTTSSRSECPDRANNSMPSEEEMQLGSPLISKDRLAAEKIHNNFQILPNSKQCIDRKWQKASSSTLSSIGVIKDESDSHPTSIQTAREQRSVDSFSSPSIYPMIGSLQNVTVFVPCQMLTSAIPPISTSQYPSFSSVCEHADEIRPPIFNQTVQFHDASANPTCVKTDTFTQSNFKNNHPDVASESATVSDGLKEDKDTCSNDSVSPMHPWRPW